MKTYTRTTLLLIVYIVSRSFFESLNVKMFQEKNMPLSIIYVVEVSSADYTACVHACVCGGGGGGLLMS